MSKQNIVQLQALRAIVALAVTAWHFQLGNIHSLNRTTGLPDLRVGNAGVDPFFVISGFVGYGV